MSWPGVEVAGRKFTIERCQPYTPDMGAGASCPTVEPALSDAGKAALLTHLQVSFVSWVSVRRAPVTAHLIVACYTCSIRSICASRFDTLARIIVGGAFLPLGGWGFDSDQLLCNEGLCTILWSWQARKIACCIPE